MFNDINKFCNKRRFVKEKLKICDMMEIEWNSFVYTTCNPNELVGMRFLERLLETVKNPLVYLKLIEFIVKLVVHLDESLFDQVEPIRK